MEPYDLEIGPIKSTFDHLFASIGLYFQSAPVVPIGSITETSLSNFSQEQLQTSLNASLKHYGFADLPSSIRIITQVDSQISGIHRSDNITIYEERIMDGSHRTFNFYSTYGPENLKVSYYWLNIKKDGEQTQGILTMDDRWYLRISTKNHVYYLRIEKEIPRW
ncbi:hypothetical protein A2159_02345 [Candidatus Woesebacteria bacterium RBG_13_34_9]|uniref:Uncharacterized protein n=1 Tax=Candidatus Woesebacteria bacterium RBG_13_34_9 TaxID=1802477 RepID=A0A1F7X2W5_9BACT|nr:MAG: hypothetical protein A2159_02345 [Candidatus Woesebacteria bacterium RBG_13_34_9]